MSRNSFAELPEYNSDQESEKAPEKTTEKPTEKKTRKPKVQWAFVEKFETNELAQEFVKKESIWSFKREYETVDSYNKTYRCNFVTQRSKLQCPASLLLKYNAEDETVTVFISGSDHDHDGLVESIRGTYKFLY